MKKKRRGVDMRIGGWAKTVLSQASEAFVDKAASMSSSVPSLDSASVGESPSVVGAEARLTAELRHAKYRLAMADLEKEADACLYLSDADYQNARRDLMEEYADVAYTTEERVKRDLMSKVLSGIGDGLSGQMIDRFVDLGLMDKSTQWTC